jgi:hypothetical protein
MPLVAMNSRWEETRFISVMSMRIHVARSGSSMSSSFSTVREKASSVNSGEA